MIFDAHFHYAVCKEKKIFNSPYNWAGLSCAHSIEEWNIQADSGNNVFKAFGIHPQVAGQLSAGQRSEYMRFMEELAAGGKLNAIGEAGFDFFSANFKSSSIIQEEMWKFQLHLAEKYQLPLVVHCRKANEKLFEYSSQLKKIPGVLFHSFMGSIIEANSLIKRNINCYFSFGKQIFNNNKKVIDCVSHIPINRLLLETDAPFQFLKGEEVTFPNDIEKVYKGAFELRKSSENCSFQSFCNIIFNNGISFLPTLKSAIQI